MKIGLSLNAMQLQCTPLINSSKMTFKGFGQAFLMKNNFGFFKNKFDYIKNAPLNTKGIV